MTKTEIINQLSRNAKLKKIANNIGNPKQLGDDLYQHLFVTLCEMPAKKIQDAHEKKYLEFLCIKIMQNSYHSLLSPFARQYRQHEYTICITEISHHETQDEELILREQGEQQVNEIEDYLNQAITQDNFYKITLLRRWANGESFRKISAATNIPARSIADTVKKTLHEIRWEIG